MTTSRVADHVRPRILVVSDVLLYRDGLAASLLRVGLNVVAATSAAQAEAMAERADIVVLDASVVGALKLARRLGALDRRKVIGFGIGDAEEEVLACAEAGLAGFVPRDADTDALRLAILRAMAGEMECSPRISALLSARVAALANAGHALEAPLTRREREIASLVAEGLSNKEIAGELNMGLATVKNHVHAILSKCGVRRRGAIGGHLHGVAGSAAASGAAARV